MSEIHELGDFARFVDSDDALASPQMPLMHTTDLYRFRSIIRTSKLLPTDCNTFNGEKLLYLFYGRPAYRPSSVEASSMLAYRPVCFILEPDAVKTPYRVFPFDTGAFKRDYYKQHMHEEMSVWSFQLRPTPETAMKAVKKFFGTNADYFFGKPREHITIPNFQFEANSYYNLLSERGKTSFDDRRATIEFQLNAELEITRSSICAVCMPTPFCDDPEVLNTIVTKWKADILPYPSYHATPTDDVRAIFDATHKYLKEYRYV